VPQKNRRLPTHASVAQALIGEFSEIEHCLNGWRPRATIARNRRETRGLCRRRIGACETPGHAHLTRRCNGR